MGRPSKKLDAPVTAAGRLGAAIRSRREAAHLSLQDLASVTGYSFQHLARVERAETGVSRECIAALDDALAAQGMLVALYPAMKRDQEAHAAAQRQRARSRPAGGRRARKANGHAGTATSQSNRTLVVQPTMRYPQMVSTLHRWAQSDRDQVFLSWLAKAAAVASQTQTGRPPHAVDQLGATGPRLGPADAATVSDLRSVLAAARRLDHRVGSESVIDVVSAQSRLVRAMLRSHTSPELLSLSIEFQQLHGWLLFDAGDSTQARTILSAARDTAYETDDAALMAYLLGPNLGFVESCGGQPQRGLEHSSAAIGWARRTHNQRLVSFALTIAARAHAGLSDATSTRELLDHAAAALDRHQPSADDPPWLDEFDRAALLGHSGSCMLRIGAPGEALALLTEQADGEDDRFVRNRTLALLDRACAHRELGAADRACADVTKAFRLANATTSRRVKRRLTAVTASLEQRFDTRAVRDLASALRSRTTVHAS